MKKLLWLSGALILSASMFMACEKSIGGTLDAASADGAKKITNPNPPGGGGGGGCSVALPANYFTVTTNPNPAIAGQPVTVCLTIGCGNIQTIQLLKNGVPVGDVVTLDPKGPTGCITFTPEANDCSSPSTSKYSFAITADNGSVGPGGQKCTNSLFEAGAPYCLPDAIAAATVAGNVCFTVLPPLCTDETALKITGTAETLETVDGWSTIKVTYCVKSCKDLTGVKVQGGATAGGNDGAQEVSWSDQNLATPGYPRYTNNNIVYSWTTDLTAGVEKCFTYTYKRAQTACGSVTGQWSATSANGLSSATIAPLSSCPK
jgi:hypothetical protein